MIFTIVPDFITLILPTTSETFSTQWLMHTSAETAIIQL